MARTFLELVLSDSDIRRWWGRVTTGSGDECWTWGGAHHSKTGYAYIYVMGNNRPAHRVGYIIHNGPIPRGLVLDHLCRNRWCVNPGHLEPVTDRENLLRGVGASAINAAKTHCPRGHSYVDLPSGRRGCRTCTREIGRAFYLRRRDGVTQ